MARSSGRSILGAMSRRWPMVSFALQSNDVGGLFIRFVLIGGLNTLFGYGLFAVLILLGLPTMLALLLSTTGGVVFNYFTTRQLVFAWRDGHRLLRFALVYIVIYALNAAALLAFKFAMSPLLAQAILLPFFVVLAFLCNRYFVFNLPRKLPS